MKHCALALVACLLRAGSASADSAGPAPDEAVKNAAQSLFDEGRRLMDAGQIGVACSKFQESFRLHAASGTLLNLALCNERAGATGTAYTQFNDSVARAQRENRPEREQLARDHLSTLAPRLSRITVTLDPAAEAQAVEVTLDGIPWRKAAWGVATMVDPGEHVVAARAAGKATWTRKTQVGPNGDRVTVVVPALEGAGDSSGVGATVGAPVEPLTPQGPSWTDSTPRVASVVLLGAAVVSAGVGAGFGITAKSQWDAALNACPSRVCPDTATLSKNNGAGTWADGSTAAFVVAGAALGAAAVLYLTAPTTQARVSVVVTPTFAGIGLAGSL